MEQLQTILAENKATSLNSMQRQPMASFLLTMSKYKIQLWLKVCGICFRKSPSKERAPWGSKVNEELQI